jgi:hypothetical protein
MKLFLPYSIFKWNISAMRRSALMAVHEMNVSGMAESRDLEIRMRIKGGHEKKEVSCTSRCGDS